MTPAASPRLFLIDGSSYIFRAFFAMPELYNAAGLPTNAIFGFTNMMIDLLKHYQPDYVAVALDAGRDTFRNGMFDDYKANRLAPPANLMPQFPYFRKVLQVLSFPLFELPGYEADDIIATFAISWRTKIVKSSSYRATKISCSSSPTGSNCSTCAKNRWVGFAEVIDKFGVTPDRVTQVMGLMGDAR